MTDDQSNGSMRKKVRQVYGFINRAFYLNRPDLEINGEPYNSALLMGLLTGLCQGKELIIGEPGLGKTTSAEYISALLFRLPMGTIWRSEISGHPEQTEEKIIGRPDLGRLYPGGPADMMVFPARNWSEFCARPATQRVLLRGGKVQETEPPAFSRLDGLKDMRP